MVYPYIYIHILFPSGVKNIKLGNRLKISYVAYIWYTSIYVQGDEIKCQQVYQMFQLVYTPKHLYQRHAVSI